MEAVRVLRASEYIRQRPAANFHHGIRVAHYIGYDLNLFTSINLSLTDCQPEQSSIAFAKMRAAFGKWITRPKIKDQRHKAPPTFVWVLENSAGCLNAHWLLHVPDSRKKDFQKLLPAWVKSCVGAIHSTKAIDVRPAVTPRSIGKYMLKGMHPYIAAKFDIQSSDQGRVFGKRLGTSRNLGPSQKRNLRRAGKYPPSRQWRSFTKKATLCEAGKSSNPLASY